MGYIYQDPQWPNFIYDELLISKPLDNVRYLQGWLLGVIESLGFEGERDSLFQNLTADVINTSAIEGEILDIQQVRSSIARKLGIEYAGLVSSDRSVDGIVNVLIDATLNNKQQLTRERLFAWHQELFPSGFSGFSKIDIGDYRSDANGPMQVVSGPIGREKVHFQAIDSFSLQNEMSVFIQWFNVNSIHNPIIKAAIAHLWFVTLHPFDDGNGRIARALTDMLLARSEMKAQRFYSMSSEIKVERQSYYKILEQTQKGSIDITNWLLWFLDCLEKAILKSKIILESTIKKTDFWHSIRSLSLNQRQTKILNMLFDHFEGKLTTSKWAKICKCSQDTAHRDIVELIELGIFEKSSSSGRSTNYQIKNEISS